MGRVIQLMKGERNKIAKISRDEGKAQAPNTQKGCSGQVTVQAIFKHFIVIYAERLGKLSQLIGLLDENKGHWIELNIFNSTSL